MALRRLCKAEDSGNVGQCPAVYVAESPERMVAQGKVLDPRTTSELQEVAKDELGVELPTETVLRAAALFLAEQGRPAMVDEVEAYLAGMETRR